MKTFHFSRSFLSTLLERLFFMEVEITSPEERPSHGSYGTIIILRHTSTSL